LTWKKNKSFSNLQAKARENRYKLIFNKCLKNKVNIVLTAHHKDDLYENFFIRLLRGSGLKGLSSFKSSKTKINKNLNVYIVRPLLNISKKDLSFITRNTFNFYVKDSSNENDNFLRIKVRKLINKLEQFGLTFEKFKLTLENLNKSDESIEFYVKKNIDENTNLLIKKKSIIIKENFFNQPEEVSFRSLSRLIHNFGNKKNYARGKKILSLHNDIKFNQNFKKKTLSGCIIEKVNKSIIISNEI
jgi:tRNA(Ile)-lysidine synthetase, N-terminal domain